MAWVVGGFIEKGSSKGAEVSEPGRERFAPLPPMIKTRHSHTATLLPGGKVLIAGGLGPGWTFLASVASRRLGIVPGEPRMAGQFSAVALMGGGRALITGGYGNGTGPRSSA